MAAIRRAYYVTRQLKGFRHHVVVAVDSVQSPKRGRITFQHVVVARRFTSKGATKVATRMEQRSLAA